MVVLGGGAVSYERGAPVLTAFAAWWTFCPSNPCTALILETLYCEPKGSRAFLRIRSTEERGVRLCWAFPNHTGLKVPNPNQTKPETCGAEPDPRRRGVCGMGGSLGGELRCIAPDMHCSRHALLQACGLGSSHVRRRRGMCDMCTGLPRS